MEKIDIVLNTEKEIKKKKKTKQQLFVLKCPKNKGKECKCHLKNNKKY
tara:strand:- start:957 stop:1100 length:144 start_codon:yes stop_codon:yes gene_type:complete